MKYVCKEEYRTFRGYVFAHHNPVDVTDRGTLEAIGRDGGFAEYHDEPKQEVLPDNACPKCHKPLKNQGRHIHIKFCKGV